MLILSGMEGAAMDYASHSHAIAHIPLGQSSIDSAVLHQDIKNDTLLLKTLSRSYSTLPKDPIYVHFEIKHKYFDGLHKALICLNKQALRKLFPRKRYLKRAVAGRALTSKEEEAIRHIPLDEEYQMVALRRMISSDPSVPFLVLGPFGTGKTQVP